MSPASQTPRCCACPRKGSLDGRRPNVRYASAACRSRVYRERHGIVGYRAVKPSPNGNRRRVELRISYRRAVEAVGHELGVTRAEQILASCLTPKQREALDRRVA